VVLPEGLGVDADDTGDVGFGDAVSGEGLDVATAHRGGLVGRASHGQASSRAERGGRSSSGRDRTRSAEDLGDEAWAEQGTPRSSATSTKTVPFPSRIAASPVKSCQRRMATST